MNIFYLHYDTKICAQEHLDKHVVKMIVEYAQLMSTAHRIIDGNQYFIASKSNRKVHRWKLDDYREDKLYHAVSWNHPSAMFDVVKETAPVNPFTLITASVLSTCCHAVPS